MLGGREAPIADYRTSPHSYTHTQPANNAVPPMGALPPAAVLCKQTTSLRMLAPISTVGLTTRRTDRTLLPHTHAHLYSSLTAQSCSTTTKVPITPPPYRKLSHPPSRMHIPSSVTSLSDQACDTCTMRTIHNMHTRRFKPDHGNGCPMQTNHNMYTG